MKSLVKSFSAFTGIGIMYAVLQIVLLWLFVDILTFETLITTAVVATLLYVIKFYTYVFVKLMKNKFMHYNATNFIMLVLNILFVWILVDFLGMLASVSSALVSIIFFILRFVILRKVGIIHHDF